MNGESHHTLYNSPNKGVCFTLITIDERGSILSSHKYTQVVTVPRGLEYTNFQNFDNLISMATINQPFEVEYSKDILVRYINFDYYEKGNQSQIIAF